MQKTHFDNLKGRLFFQNKSIHIHVYNQDARFEGLSKLMLDNEGKKSLHARVSLDIIKEEFEGEEDE